MSQLKFKHPISRFLSYLNIEICNIHCRLLGGTPPASLRGKNWSLKIENYLRLSCQQTVDYLARGGTDIPRAKIQS
jgi:hypothetical protein